MPRNEVSGIIDDMNIEQVYIEGKGWAYRKSQDQPPQKNDLT
jgi:hypothetical protein